MATKKQNRRYKVRQVRRALNATTEVTRVTGGRLYRHRYGDGAGRLPQ